MSRPLSALLASCALLLALYSARAVAADITLERDGWYRWEVAAGDTGRKACCYRLRGGEVQRTGCRLGDSGDGMTLDDDCDVHSDAMRIYVEVRNGRVREIQPLSSSCPVTTGAEIREIEAVSTADSIAWLVAQAKANPSVTDEAVMTVSFHSAKQALDALVSLLEDQGQRMETREQALFWMVQSGSDEAFAYLDRLLD